MSQQVDNKTTKQVRIDAGYHHLIKIKAAKTGRTIKELVEGFIAEGLGTDYQKHGKEKK